MKAIITKLNTIFIVDGICEDISAGTTSLQVWAGICRHHSKVGECYFGWNSYVHLMVSETFVEREIHNF